jgi:phosphatidate cytidylyltransferase
MLLSNPIASPMWPTLGWTFFGLFGGSLLALLVNAHGRWRQLSSSVLFKRWRTWVAIAAIFTLAVLSGPLATAVFAAALAAQACREYSHLVDLSAADRRLLLCAAIGLPFACLILETAQLAAGLILIPLVASLPTLLSQDVRHGLQRLPRLAFGLWYAPLTLGLLVLLEREPHGGPGLILCLSLATALSDVGAFSVGRLLGRFTPPLAVTLSPSKTLAGVAGNVLGAALGLLLLRPLAPEAPLLLLVPLVAVGAVWGDLLESLLKRAAGAKDAGDWLPGFGGVLDRIDSLLVVLPLAAVALAVMA